MNRCSGAVVIALERTYFPAGTDRPKGPRQTTLTEVRLPTPWNQIEAAMAYSRGLPLLMLVQQGLKPEGLLEEGYNWYVQEITLDASTMATTKFNGVMSTWKERLQKTAVLVGDHPKTEDMSVAGLLGSLKPAQLWSTLAGIAVLVGGAFSLGLRIAGGK